MNLGHIESEAFSASAGQADDVLEVTLVGNADLRVRQELADWLLSLHREALELQARRVVVDVMELEFMNSSCFKGFVSWLTEIMALPKEAQYRVHFRSNPETLWQRRSLHALRSLALMIVTVEG
jgi:hypothetical protein